MNQIRTAGARRRHAEAERILKTLIEIASKERKYFEGDPYSDWSRIGFPQMRLYPIFGQSATF